MNPVLRRALSHSLPPLHRTPAGAMLVIGALALGAPAAAQTTWYVDDDHPGDPGAGNPFVSNPAENGSAGAPFDRIQEGIDAAMDGDTVLVSPGLYFDFATIDLSSGMGPAKALTIQSTGGSAVTTIDAAALFDTVVEAVSMETAQTVFEGFTLTGGDPGLAPGAEGGGLLLLNSSPTIRDVVLDGNQAYIGGGVRSLSSSSVFEDCRFVDNYAEHQGGGAYLDLGNVRLERCTFETNQALVGGGGLIRRGNGGSLTVEDSLFHQNDCPMGTGGGLAKWDAGALRVERSRFVANVASGHGGGVFVSGGGTILDSLVNGNTSSTTVGGGVVAWSLGPTLVIGSTITNNSGDAIWIHAAGSLVLRNGIVWGNVGQTIGNNPGAATVTYTDITGGWVGTGNVSVDPFFVDDDGLDNVIGNLDDDLRLSGVSPCIDAGDSTVVSNPSPHVAHPLDIAGRPRAVDRPDRPDTGVAVLGLTVDMGAHERPRDPSAPLGIVKRSVQ